MASKTRVSRETQMRYWQEKLSSRVSFLKAGGVEEKKIARDITVRNLRARIRETLARLKTIEKREEKLDQMARSRAEKLAEPKKEKVKKKGEAEEKQEASKRQQKKQKKREEKDIKEKETQE